MSKKDSLSQTFYKIQYISSQAVIVYVDINGYFVAWKVYVLINGENICIQRTHI